MSRNYKIILNDKGSLVVKNSGLFKLKNNRHNFLEYKINNLVCYQKNKKDNYTLKQTQKWFKKFMN